MSSFVNPLFLLNANAKNIHLKEYKILQKWGFLFLGFTYIKPFEVENESIADSLDLG